MNKTERQREPSDEASDDLVVHTDPDRYVASLFAPPGRARGLRALYVFNAEVARIRELVHEPLVGHIRLGWWRDQIAAVFESRGTAAPVAAVRETIKIFALPRDLFDAYLDARALDFNEAAFADEAALEIYTAATAGSLMKLAARVCGADDRADEAAHHAAIAIAYAGFIRSLGFDATRRFCRLPLSWLDEEGLAAADLFASQATPQLTHVVARLAAAARRHAHAARAARFPRAAIAALAPMALVESYLRRSARGDPFGKPAELSPLERTARIAVSALTWRI